MTGIDLAYFPRPKRLHVLADIGDRGVKLPAQPVVEGQIWFDLPAVLCEQIKPCAAYVLDLGRPLTIRTGKSKEIVGEGGVSCSCVGRGSVNKELAIHVKVQSLVKSLATNVAAKLQRVFPDNLTDSVRPLEGIAYLRQFALTVVSDRESAAHLNERKPLVFRTEIGMNAQRVLRSAIGEARHRTGNISEPCRSGRTGILNYRREGGMLKCPLRLTVEVEAELIDSTIADGPGMADVPLLKPFVDDGPKPRNVRARRLKHRKRGDLVIVVKIIVEAEVLPIVDAVINLHRKLVGTHRLHRRSHKLVASVRRSGNILQQVNRGGVETG